MSEPGIPTENKEQSEKQPDRQNPPQQEWNQYFQLRWAAFSQFLRPHISRCQRNYQKAKLYSAAMGGAPANLLTVVITAIVVAGAIHFLNAAGVFDDTNKVIALLTFVLAVVGFLQWWTYHQQWKVMKEQLKQTDELVLASKLDQRPWVTVLPPTIEPIVEGGEIKCEFELHNVGKTPATVTIIKRGIFPLPTNVHPAQIAGLPGDIDCNRVVLIQARRISIAPGGKLKHSAEAFRPMESEQWADFKSGMVKIYVFGVIHYLDMWDVGHQTKFLYSYSDPRGEVRVEISHNEML